MRISNTASDNEIEEYYQLYLNVKNNSLALNTFTLPEKLFHAICKSATWEIIRIEENSLVAAENNNCIGVVLAKKVSDNYAGVIVGLDYTVNTELNVYRRAVYETIKRGKALGCEKINLGFSAGIEKKKFGAKSEETCAYLQVKDNFVMSALNTNTVMKSSKIVPNAINEGRILSV